MHPARRPSILGFDCSGSPATALSQNVLKSFGEPIRICICERRCISPAHRLCFPTVENPAARRGRLAHVMNKFDLDRRHDRRTWRLPAVVGISFIALIALAGVLPPGGSQAQSAAVKYDDLAPIRQSRCEMCHDGSSPAAGLRLDSLECRHRVVGTELDTRCGPAPIFLNETVWSAVRSAPKRTVARLEQTVDLVRRRPVAEPLDNE